AAAGFTCRGRWDRTVARLVAGGMAAVSLFVIGRAFADHHRLTAERDHLDAAPRQAAALGPAVVFLPPLDGPYLLQPFSLARNSSFDGPVLWAIDRGPRPNLEVVLRLPGRTPYRVVQRGTRRSPTLLECLPVVGG